MESNGAIRPPGAQSPGDRSVVKPSLLVGADPAEAAVDETKSVEVHELELQVDLVIVHLAIENQSILLGSLEGEAGFPLRAVSLREGVVVDVD